MWDYFLDNVCRVRMHAHAGTYVMYTCCVPRTHEVHIQVSQNANTSAHMHAYSTSTCINVRQMVVRLCLSLCTRSNWSCQELSWRAGARQRYLFRIQHMVCTCLMYLCFVQKWKCVKHTMSVCENMMWASMKMTPAPAKPGGTNGCLGHRVPQDAFLPEF